MSEEIHIQYDPVPRMVCVFCHARMDVSKIAPFSKAVCPSCKNEVTVPARLGAFLLTELLGTGGMGGVYRAHDETLGRDVAIKVMLKSLGDNPEFVSSFRREAQAAAKLNHPNIAQIYSFGQEKGQPYIVMELVPGMHFDQMIAAPDPLDIPMVMKIGMDIAEGLQLAADANLIHGDIKPENILLDERNQAKLVDFGIAAKPSQSENEIWGTPYYIAPERVRRQRVDYRSDIYCLGGTLYHAITQHPPFEGADAIEVVRARLKGPPTPLIKYRPDADPAVSAIIARMLQMEPAMRYPTYGSLLSDMRAYLRRVQPKAPVSRTTRRVVIKGRKAAMSGGGASTTSPLPAATGHMNTGTITRTHPLVITRGMFPDPTLPQDDSQPVDTAESPDPATPSKPGRWKRGCLIGGLVLLAVLVAGGGGAWLYLRHQIKTRVGQMADEQAQFARWLGAAATAHGAIVKGQTDLLTLEAQANALVTQAVALVEGEIGTDWTDRIIFEEAEDDLDGLAGGAETSEAIEPGGTNGAARAEGEAVGVNEEPVGVEEEAADAAVADETADENADTDEDDEEADDAADEPAPVEAAPPAEDGEAVTAVEAEPLPPLAQMARDVHQAARPLRQALREAQRAVGRADALHASLQGGTNELAAIQSAVERLQSIANRLQADLIQAPRTIDAAQKHLDQIVRAIAARAAEREREAEAARSLAEEQRAAAAEAARQEAERAAIQAEVDRVTGTVAAQREALLRHQYANVLRDLRRLELDLTRAESKAAMKIAIQRVTGLQDLRIFLIKRLNETPFKSADGWSVQSANERTLTIRTSAGKVLDTQWDDVGIKQMAEFIKFYILDREAARDLRLRERFAQTVNGAVYCVTFGFGGEHEESARAMAGTLLQMAIEMLPTERAATLGLLPELGDPAN